MIYAFCGLCFAACFACVFFYTLGIKHGRIVSSGGQPRMPNPVRAITEVVDAKKAAEEDAEFAASMAAYNKESMLKAYKRGVTNG